MEQVKEKSGQELLLMFKIQIKENCDHCDFNHVMDVDTRLAVLSISETEITFSPQPDV